VTSNRMAAPASGLTGLSDAGSGGAKGPVIILGYQYCGAGHVQTMLSAVGSFACTSGTGLLPLCESAALAWRQVEGGGLPLSALARASIRALTDALITTVLAGSGGSRWCEVAFAHPECADIFRQVYPSAKFVCVHQSCATVITTVVRANPWGLADPALQAFGAHYPGNNAAAIAAFWVTHTEPLLDFERANPDACCRVRYEDLVGNPDQAVNAICSFLAVNGNLGTTPHPVSGAGIATPGRQDPLTADEIPAGLIPAPLTARVNELMTRLKYPPLSALGRPAWRVRCRCRGAGGRP
jgi:hypothetical protein